MVKLNLNVPEEFYLEETRCGFTVSAERKQLWAVELDLMAEFDRVCKKHDLHYCVGAGTLLGAIRHNGFIPWDNDVDLYMLRNDYDKLMKLSDEFKHPYFLQNPTTDKHYSKLHAKLRNSSTTGYIKSEMGLDMNKGVFIDIFPIDGVIENEHKNKIAKFIYTKTTAGMKQYRKCMDINNTDKWNGMKRMVFKVITNKFMCQIVDIYLKLDSKKGTKIWGNKTLVYDCPKSRRPLRDYRKFKYVRFEFLMVPIPVNYDEMLRQQYGNYMRLPKVVNGSRHGTIVFSAEEDYRSNTRRKTVL